MRFILVIFACLIILQCNRTEHSATQKNSRSSDTISVAFYNVQNLFDLDYSGAEYPEFKPGVSNWDRDMMQKKLERIASVIVAMNAEVVGLCEVENSVTLKKLQRVLEYSGYAFRYSAIADGPVKSNTCPALISHYPIKNYRGIAVPLSGGITRNILEADVLIGSDTLKVFVNHWPSKRNPESWRMACAKVLSLRLKEIPAGTDYILMGDFNSDYDDHFKITTTGTDDTKGLTGMHLLLNTVYKTANTGFRFVNENDLRTFQKGIHYDLWLELPESGRMSHFFKGNRQTPDHILLPGALYDSSGISYIDNSFQSFTWDGRLLINNRPFRWQIFQNKGINLHTGKGYSDHLPIRALFETGPFRSEQSEGVINGQNASPDSFSDSSESLRRGWMLCNSDTEIFTDTIKSCNGSYSLRIQGAARKSNGCVAKLKVHAAAIPSQGLSFNIQGSGRICLRSCYDQNKWEYLDLNTMRVSKNASYPLVHQEKWQRITFKKSISDSGCLNLEIRTGKGEPFCLWIN